MATNPPTVVRTAIAHAAAVTGQEGVAAATLDANSTVSCVLRAQTSRLSRALPSASQRGKRS